MKLASGEELVTIVLLPYGKKDIEESIENGFAFNINLIFPATYSKKRNKPVFSFWCELSEDRSFKIPFSNVVLMTEVNNEVKEMFTLFLKENALEEEQVGEQVQRLLDREEFVKEETEDMEDDDFELPGEKKPQTPVFH